MLPYEIIRNKRDGNTLSEKDIREFIEGYVAGEIPDYQMSAFLMAVYFRGMDERETLALTKSYIESGEQFNFREIGIPTSDKHSTGGVGDKVSLVLAPMVAACGVAVPMISGRGLGHTGGTLDKLESIPNFNTNLSTEDCIRNLKKVGFFIAAQTKNLVPADKKIYALRDVTATVESIPLIVASIMSKKLAEGSGSLVLDVKFGNGAFMKNLRSAKVLARAMVDVGNLFGVPTAALLTDMNQPLGQYVGNALEVRESILYLRGDVVPDDLHKITLALGSIMLVLSKAAKNLKEGAKMLDEALKNGAALKKFEEFIAAQGGNPDVVENLDLLPTAPVKAEICADKNGWVEKFDTFGIGMLGVEIGAGRSKVDDKIDHSVGFRFLKKRGDKVHKGEVIAEIFAKNEDDAELSSAKLKEMIKISEKPVRRSKLLHKVIFRDVRDFSFDSETL